MRFDYAQPSEVQDIRTNATQRDAKFVLSAGAKNGDTFGINWNNVISVSGQTYNLREEMRDRDSPGIEMQKNGLRRSEYKGENKTTSNCLNP